MRDDDDEQQLKIELLSKWKLEAESRKKLQSSKTTTFSETSGRQHSHGGTLDMV